MAGAQKTLPKPDAQVGGYLVSNEGGKTVVHDDGNKGGLLVGKRHSEGGIQMDNTSANTNVEAETMEVLLTPNINNSNKTYELDGKKMTAKEVASTLNVEGGGVQFKKGGTIGERHRSQVKTYKFGGKTMTDAEILAEIAKDNVVDEREGTNVQVGGGAIVITRGSVMSEELHDFNGQKLKPIDILSKLNEEAGGSPFSLDDNSENIEVNTCGKEYEYGGKLMKDYDIVNDCGCKHAMRQGGEIDMTDWGRGVYDYGVKLLSEAKNEKERKKILQNVKNNIEKAKVDIKKDVSDSWDDTKLKLAEFIVVGEKFLKDYSAHMADGGSVGKPSGKGYNVSCISNLSSLTQEDQKLVNSTSDIRAGEHSMLYGYKQDRNKEDKLVWSAMVTWDFDGKYCTINSVASEYEKGGSLEIGKLSEGKSLADIAHMHALEEKDIREELQMGIQHEYNEHTNNKVVAMKIALDHLVENPHYYTELQKIEEEATPDYDEHLDILIVQMKDGGEIAEDTKFSFTTPTGKKSKLTYLQQVLVRTKAFKNYFGDWETAAKYYLHHSDKPNADEREVFRKYYADVSKVIDFATLEPKAVWHGSMSAQEFFIFDAVKEKGVGRPYAYFAVNKVYAQNFSKSSQRGEGYKPLLYSAFLNIRKPFMALGHDYDQKRKDGKYWLTQIKGTITYDKYGDVVVRKDLNAAIDSQIKKYVDDTFSSDAPFWTLMARDTNKDFKYFLMSYGFDGVAYSEEYSSGYDANNPAEFTYAYTIFDARQIKLADGRNLTFDPMSADIRYEKGGTLINHEPMQNQPESNEERLNRLRSKVLGDNYEAQKAERGAMYKLGGELQENKEKAGNFDTPKRETHNPNVEYVNKLIERSKQQAHGG